MGSDPGSTLNFQLRIQTAYTPDQICRTYAFSFCIGITIGEDQLFSRFRHIQIQIEPLHIHQFFRSRCQFHSLFLKEISVKL